MQHLAEHNQPTEPAPAGVRTHSDDGPAKSVREQLEDAQSADQAWRGDLAVRLRRRREILRQCETLIPRWGAGLGVLLMLTAIFMTYGVAYVDDDGTFGRVLVALIYTTTGFTAASLVLLKSIAWYHSRTRTWMTPLGIGETPDSSGQNQGAAHLTHQVVEDWICPECWQHNPGTITECAACTRMRPEVAARSKFRVWGKVVSALGPRLLSALAWLMIALILLYLALSILASLSSR